jgi:hypothetical protein
MRLKKRVQQSNRRRAPAHRIVLFRFLRQPFAQQFVIVGRPRVAIVIGRNFSIEPRRIHRIDHRVKNHPSCSCPSRCCPFTPHRIPSLLRRSRCPAPWSLLRRRVHPCHLVRDSWCTRLYTLFRRSPCLARRPVLARHTIPASTIPDKNVFVTFLPFYCFHETRRSVRAPCSILFLYYFLNVRTYATMSFT